MYICLHLCMLVCMYVYTHACLYVCNIYVCLHHVFVYDCVAGRVHKYTHTLVSIRAWECSTVKKTFVTLRHNALTIERQMADQ